MKKLCITCILVVFVCSCRSEPSPIIKEKSTYTFLIFNDSQEVEDMKVLPREKAKEFLEVIAINYNNNEPSSDIQDDINVDEYSYNELLDTIEDDFLKNIIIGHLHTIMQASIWNHNGYQIYDLCLPRYHVNSDGHYEVRYSESTWGQIKKYIELYQEKTDNFTYTIID